MPPFRLYIAWIQLLLIFHSAFSSYSEDQCSWRGSGLSQLPGRVEQISLHCAEGSLEWLYPKGALRLTLSPRPPRRGTGSGGGGGAGPGGPVTACVEPAGDLGGAQLYVERDGALELLAGEGAGGGVRCVGRRPGEHTTLFLQATPQRDISRRIAAFRYELRGDWGPRPALTSDPVGGEGACRPCNDTEMLMAVCTSDFVVRGSIRSVADDRARQTSVIRVEATRVFRQKRALFSGVGRLARAGEVMAPLRCGVRPGRGSFLFTGHVRFGEAWLGCAPRYGDFRRAYDLAQREGQIPCELPSD